MRFQTLALLSAIAAPLVAALDKPLDIQVTHKVDCNRRTKSGDTIEVHYRGTLEDGSVFDASYDRGQPLSFTLDQGQVIKGWDKGLQDMCVGEKRVLTIQPEWAYGQRGVGPIPAGAVLTFETEMMGIKGVSKDEL